MTKYLLTNFGPLARLKRADSLSNGMNVNKGAAERVPPWLPALAYLTTALFGLLFWGCMIWLFF
jgi:hypothetical protein